MGLSDMFSELLNSLSFSEAHAEAPPTAAVEEDNAEAEEEAVEATDEEEEEEAEEAEEEEEEPVDIKPILEAGKKYLCASEEILFCGENLQFVIPWLTNFALIGGLNI